jgi:hypothetical protein
MGSIVTSNKINGEKLYLCFILKNLDSINFVENRFICYTQPIVPILKR